MMSAADTMHQMTMMQCYKSNSVLAAAAAAASTPSPVLPAHISCMPPGFHYFAMNGMAYFLNSTTSEKVKLGPVESSRMSSLTPVDLDATSSFATPSVKKKERAKRHSMVHLKNNEEVVCVGHKKNKRSESHAARKKVIPAELNCCG
jgi:hypothetical protein